MKIQFHADVLARQRYSCNCCGAGCRSFLVGVRPVEREAILKLEDWSERLQLTKEKVFVMHPAAGRLGYGLAKRADGSCVFLDDENLCLIHKLHGMKAKPLACQLYPFILTPVAGKLHVGLRFDCPAVVRNEGAHLSTYERELKQLCQDLITPEIENLPLPPVYAKHVVGNDKFLAINEAFLKIVDSTALDLVERLYWLYGFSEHLKKVKWDKVTDEDFSDLISMLQGGVLAEVQREKPPRNPIAGKPRKLLGQIFFLLCQPTTVITQEREGFFQKIKKRLALHRTSKHVGEVTGPLPKIQPNWPDCDLSELETSFGPWPEDVQKTLTRYLSCRIGGLGYCGHNFYKYSMLEGIQTLLLGMVTLGWVMRIQAVQAGRKTIAREDAYDAILAIDGNLGYSSALGFGPSRWRLHYLNPYLKDFLTWYCT
jgi:lysine-N-methylase